jgi:hypothetical protein
MRGVAYSEILVRGFLPFLGHRAWRRPSESVYCEEETCRNTDTNSRVEKNLGPLSGRIFSSRTVRTKGNPPSWYALVYSAFIASNRSEPGTGCPGCAKARHSSNGVVHIPAFFSCRVISFQSTFIRSLNCIQSSACSCGGIPSHLFSIPAKVGFEMA